MYHIFHTKSFSWYTDTTWRQLALKSIGYKFVNPLLILDEYQNRGLIMNFAMYGQKYFFVLSGIIIKSKNNREPSLEESYKIAASIQEFMLNLRYASRQYKISANDFVHSIAHTKKVTWNNSQSPLINVIPVWKSHLSTAINQKMLKYADSLMIKKTEIKSYNDIALDAYESYMGKDFKKSILYSAMAAEILLNYHYNFYYSKIINSKRQDSRYRVKKIRAQGKIILKEPILERLLDDGKYKFKMLLHEIPLYILNHSLNYENQQLYQDLMTLHLTRNKIVHIGKVFITENEKLLTINDEGALNGLETLQSLYNFFKDNYIDDLISEIQLKKSKG